MQCFGVCTRGDKDLAFCSHYAALLGMYCHKSRRRNGSVKGAWAAVVRGDKRVGRKPNVIVDSIWGCDNDNCGQLDNIDGGGSISQSRTPLDGRRGGDQPLPDLRSTSVKEGKSRSRLYLPRHHGVGDSVFDAGTEDEGGDDAGDGDP
ncbi:hypothetical protein FIBSPDRAFT_899440 [Athelia psychrophila]|uniref:Uncharacterized protein n=1 Tax=Athelia psychrophila TaxID=1759441 RepID=A0A165ZPM3_9AGAM|nr:hypothetical protein FIBSPDRAFT_899440 [Fibularhizoctonia sp. CBS 109695]